MSEEQAICPYTGLRSFTEDESLYFKGREEQINQVILQLEEKKFLMVTGASGDGKSSLIFAGLIPQARAGFFKARYSNWHVADFRPERAPLKNMAAALSLALKQDTATIETELSRGFSSLSELFKTSIRYTDVTSNAYLSASEDDQGSLERESGNLLILIDQFEEFFTNPENFPGGVPSQESRLLLNIILETAKISLKENLPIYIVCTMRSDYIGQCASFRGLPEFIGFSQFFVPRLQRKELYQVIEEPAILSGNKISKRLIDRLIVDVEEGTDQLPILQHALKEIWKAASEGQEEMDLVHYAMVGGMSGDNLPKEVKEKFMSWKLKLPEHEKAYLESPGLANILDIHASKLYENAAAYCAQHGHPEVTTKQARFIIAMTFACLTRIDGNRAVRNRMTLQEIANIIDSPQYTTEVVRIVLSIFREPENTLVRPFITQDINFSLSPDTVLDITHEALIRNWKLLKKWADQEFEFYNTFLDFQKQVNRWYENGKSDDFLLPIGTLTYFENWNKKCRPNQFWINRYHTEEERKDHRLKQSAIMLKKGKEYLRKSALSLFVTRTFMKYGAGRIAAVASAIVFIVLSSFAVYNWRIRQNDYVIESILKEGEILLSDRELISFDHSYFTAEAEHLRPGYIKRVLPKLPEQQRIIVSLNLSLAFVLTEIKNPPLIVRQSMLLADSLIQASGAKLDSTNLRSANQHISNLNGLVRNLSVFLFHNQDNEMNNLLTQYARHQAILVRKMVMQKRQVASVDMKALHIAITDALNFNGFTTEERAQFLAILSPLEGKPFAIARFNEWFPVDEKIAMGAPDKFSHNGGYQALAYLYASIGNVPRTLQCLDSLKKHNQNYDKALINSTHIAISLFTYGFQKEFKQFVKAYAKRVDIPAHRYLKHLLDKCSVSPQDAVIKFFKAGNFNNRFAFISENERKQFFALTKELTTEELKAGDALNFNLALLNKLEGILIIKKEQERGVISSTPDSLFQAALSYYNQVSPPFLNESIEIQMQEVIWAADKKTIPRKHQFLYPDNFKTNETFLSVSSFNFYNDAFFHFLLTNNLFSKLYKGEDDFKLVTTWASRFFDWYGQVALLHYPDPGTKTFEQIDSLVTQSSFDLDNAWVKMKLISNYFKTGDTVRAFRQLHALKFKTFENPDFTQSWPFKNMVIQIASELAMRGKSNEALNLISNFSNRKNRVKAYAAMAELCLRNNRAKYATLYMDSVNAEMSRLKTFTYQGNDFRIGLVQALTLQNTDEGERKALEYLSVMKGYDRFGAFIGMASCFAFIDEYYKAKSLLPVSASSGDRTVINWQILFNENFKKGSSDEWKSYAEINSQHFFWTQNDLLPD